MTVTVDLPVQAVEINGDNGTTSVTGSPWSVEVETPAESIGLGIPGPQGKPGSRGSLWWSGDGPPVEIPYAIEGDMYLDNLTGDVYWLEVATPPPVNGNYGESAYGTGPYGGS